MKPFRLCHLYACSLFLLVFSSCRDNINDHFPKKHIQNSNIEFNELKLDSFKLQNFHSSFTGKLLMLKDSIYFVDARFGTVSVFNSNGTYIREVLGQGTKPTEIDAKYIDAALITDQVKVFIGSTFDAYVYDANWINKKNYYINWQRNKKE